MIDDAIVQLVDAVGSYQYRCRSCGYRSKASTSVAVAEFARRIHRHRYVVYRICRYQRLNR